MATLVSKDTMGRLLDATLVPERDKAMRKIEVKVGGEWVMPTAEQTSIEDAKRYYADARYVGGVLEYQRVATGEWKDVHVDGQHFTPSERAAEQGVTVDAYRLRPYDDAAVPTTRQGWEDKIVADVASKMAPVPKARGRLAAGSSPPGTHTTDQRTKEMRAIMRTDVSAVDCSDFGDKVIAASANYRNKALENAERANRLSDECGTLRTERDELLRENAVLRRKVEKLERKAKVRR